MSARSSMTQNRAGAELHQAGPSGSINRTATEHCVATRTVLLRISRFSRRSSRHLTSSWLYDCSDAPWLAMAMMGWRGWRGE